MKIPIFAGKYHQNSGLSMAMLVYRSVINDLSQISIISKIWDLWIKHIPSTPENPPEKTFHRSCGSVSHQKKGWAEIASFQGVENTPRNRHPRHPSKRPGGYWKNFSDSMNWDAGFRGDCSCLCGVVDISPGSNKFLFSLDCFVTRPKWTRTNV